jgi:hypothetical protein
LFGLHFDVKIIRFIGANYFLFFSLSNRPESLIPDGRNQIISNSPAVYSLLLLVGRDIITFAIRAPVVFILEKKQKSAHSWIELYPGVVPLVPLVLHQMRQPERKKQKQIIGNENV